MSKEPKKKKKKRLVLLDAHAILHRAYHALPDFSSRKGEPTGGLYGLSAMLIKIIQDLSPDYLAACYDLPGPTFRHEAYEKYKATRPAADEALVHQMNRSRDIFTAFGIPLYEKEGFEADDVIGTIVAQMKKQLERGDLEIIIASGDMDTLQLVDGKRVRVYTLKKGISDTILYDEEAVKARFGFAPKYLADFKGFRGDPSDNIPGIRGIGEKTAAQLVQLFGSVERVYAALRKNPAAFLKKGVKERVTALLKEGEEEALFSKTLASIRRDTPVSFALPRASWRESFTPDNVTRLFQDLDFRALVDRVRKSAGAESPPAASSGEGEPDREEIARLALALWLINSDLTTPSREDVLRYARADTLTEARVKLTSELEERGLLRVYRDIELPLIPLLRAAEKRGILVDVPYLKALSRDYHKELDALAQKIWKHAGARFNINSPKQLAGVLFDRLGLTAKGLKKTEGGQRSTRESELLKLRGAHPVIPDILSFRELQKLVSTYLDAIPAAVDAAGRLHTTFLQAGTTTGRMASENPNMQNIPVKGERGARIRRAFIASAGFRLVALDYSQIELRALAMLSGDKDLARIFKEGRDVHAAVASRVFGVPQDAVTKDMRRQAKVINFGIIYGMGVSSLQKNLGGTREEAEHFYHNYFSEFPGVAAYLETLKTEAARRGYTETLFGRRRYFEGINSRIPYIRSAAERMAVNAPIQGTAADIVKLAMVRADAALLENDLHGKAFLILQVHDELLYEVAEDAVDKAVPTVKRAMERVIENDVPLVADASVGKNWGEMEAWRAHQKSGS